MPPSLDQDTNSINTSGGTSNKQTQKSPSAGVQIPTKNGRKNGTAKDSGGGGVMAAVTKNNASKMYRSYVLSTGILAKMECRNSKSPAPPAPPSHFQSPDNKPAASILNGNPVTSPLLDALSSAALTTSQNTNEWAKNLPPYSSSPSNLINLGESPPTVPSSYEDRLANFGWTTREQRGIPNGHPPSASPPANHRRRPLSYHLEGTYAQTDDHHPPVSSYAARRSSMYSQYSQARYGPQPPLPHQPQAHFYGAPDANLLLSPQTRGLVPGENGYYCGFDTLPSSLDFSRPVDNVVVTGYEGGLDVYAVSRRGLNKVTKIDGLRGGVYNAKILPWNIQGGHSNQSPLIAVVVHGPVWTSEDLSNDDHAVDPSDGISATPIESSRGSPRITGQSVHDTERDAVEDYQTTVEVYSLHTKQHVATLLSVPKTHIAIPISSPLFKAPAPVGSLTIRADSGNIIIASGTTGETWIFRQGVIDGPVPERFKCIGKVWTSVQHGLTVDPTGLTGLADGDWHAGEAPSVRQQYKASILSLNGRWLAYCPSTPSSRISLRAVVPTALSTARIPGLNSKAPPQLPTVNCQVETPGGESMMKQLAQAATQEMIKGATYLGKQGVQAWNSYWNKPAANQPVNGGAPYPNQANMTHQFPPTHGVPSQAPTVTKDPGLISILDLDSLAHHSSGTAISPHPLGTFKVPHGCSFLSFAPNGLALFTASSKGDVQFVWDLMRIQYAKPSFLKTGPQGNGIQGPHVRQIAQFSRMTIARIVDVVWTSPHGERAAMVTEPGTVHVLDLPASAFTWPPPRRKLPSPKLDDEGTGTTLSASSVASSAVNSLWTAARPLVSRRRRSSTGISGITAASVTSQAGHGTQALAAGISRSVGAATGRMNEMRKAGGNKLHLPRSPVIPSRACIRLITGKRNDSVIVVGGGIIGFYTVKSRRADRPADKQKASRGAKYLEFRLPPLPDLKVAPEPVRDLQSGGLDLTEKDIEDPHWKVKQSRAKTAKSQDTESSIPQAEIESNAPYQPFHTDRRVSLYYYLYEEPPLPSTSVSALLSPLHLRDTITSDPAAPSRTAWAFGGPIKTEEFKVGPPQDTEDSVYSLSDYRALPSSAIERVMKFPDNSEGSDPIMSTTRPRKSARSSGDDTGEEGFFEDDAMFLDFASQRV